MLSKTRCRSLRRSPLAFVRPLAGALTLLGLAGVAQADTTPATGTYTTPTTNARLSSLSSIEGTATDTDSGVASVGVVLSRNWTGSNEYWTGTTWSGTSTPLSTTLGTADGNGQRPWSVSAALPAGLDFRTGRYSLRATILDAAANSTNVDLIFYSGNDTTAPQGTLVPLNPTGAYSSFVEAAQSIFKGTVRDTGGATGEDTLGRVQFRLVRTWTGVNEFWTGSEWSTTLPQVSYSLGTVDGEGYKPWQVTAAMPEGADLASGRYTAQAIFIDTSNNTTSLSSSIQVTPQDTVNPLLSVTFPAADMTLSRLVEIRGTGSDVGSGLALVNVRLRRVVGGQTQYWNGTAWTTADFILTPRTDHTWVRNTNLPGIADLPTGAYIISAQATDRYNNSSTAVTRNFSIVANTVPNGVAQSVTVAKNVARPITLTTNEAQHDAVSYITTNPSHGTLSGTAPNLVYTPNSNYIGSDSFTFTPSDWEGPGAAATVSITVVEDTTNPTAVITAPAVNVRLTTGLSAFNGAATDAGSGIASVGLLLARDWSGALEYWDSANQVWASTAPPVNAELGAANGSGERSWNWPAGVPFPSGANLLTGRYSARATARDYANRSVTVTNFFYAGNDTTAPQGTLLPLNPDPTDKLTITGDPNVSIFNGKVRDSGGATGENTLARIQFRLVRSWTGVNEFWTGSGWSTTLPQLPYSTGTVDGEGYIPWQLTATMPTGSNLATGRYTAQVIYTDTSNNTFSVNSNIQIIPVDTVNPLVSVTFPTENANLSRLQKIQGTASDPDGAGGVPGSGLSQVRVRLRRVVGGQNQYWNGSQWTTTDSDVGSRTELSWLRTGNLPSGATNLPEGAYMITAQAIDRYNNSTSVTRNFSVIANTPPSATAQSVTAVGRANTTGFPTNITLAATDNQGDDIESYHILTAPSHGTLTEVGEYWVYVADAGYFGADSFTFAARDWGGANGTPATVSINVVEPPAVDVLIKNGGDTGPYIGNDIVSTDGTNETVSQTIFAGEMATYLVQLQKEVTTQSVVLKVVGTEGTAGWTVKYYKGLSAGEDITSAVTSANGWEPTLTATDVDFRIEVTAPSNLTADAEIALLVTAGPGAGPASDTVKAVTSAKPAIQPDLEIKLASEQSYIGATVLNTTGANQTKSVQLPVETNQVFHLKVKNTSNLTSDTILMAEEIPAGWTVKYFDALTDGNDVTASVTGKGWRLSGLAPDAVREFRVEIKANYPNPPADFPFLITAWSGPTSHDVAKAEVLAQWIDHVEFSTNGTTFHAVPANGVINVKSNAPFSLRAIPGQARSGSTDSLADWPIVGTALKPKWTDIINGNAVNYGRAVAFVMHSATGVSSQGTPNYNEIQAECGNIISVKVAVTNPAVSASRLAIWQDIKAQSNSVNGRSRRCVGVLVTDGLGHPVSGATVTFGGTNLVVVDSTALTDGGGYASVLVESDGVSSNGTASATISTTPGSTTQAQCTINF